MMKLMWKRFVVEQPIRLAIGPRAEIEAKLAVVLAHADRNIEKYWMEYA